MSHGDGARTSDDLVVVLGATGGVGAALCAELVGRGQLVRGVSRSGVAPTPGVEGYGADARDPRGLAGAVDGAAVVYHCAQPSYTRWPQEFPALNEAVVSAVEAEGARLVVADNLYAYGSRPGGWGPGTAAGPLREDAEQLATGRKGAVRAQLTRDLLEAHHQGRVALSIARFSDYYGPGGVSTSFGTTVFARVLADRPAQWVGSPDHPHSIAYLPDVARAMVALGEDPTADGRIWHLPHHEASTPREFIGQVQDAAGVRRRVSAVPVAAVRAAGLVVPMARELAEVAYQVQAPFVVDHSAFLDHVGTFWLTPPEEAISRTLAWFAAQQRADRSTSRRQADAPA